MAKKKQEILDLSNKGLKSISRYTSGSQKRDHVLKLILDDNQLSSLEGVDSFDKVIQLLCRRNRLFDISGVPRKIVMINLQNNSIVNLHGFHGLVSLQWLCLAGNSIKDANVLNSCTSLTHVDLSDNFIKKLPVLTNLTSLKTLLLHGNGLKSLAKTRVSLPLSVHTLTLAENGITDLNEFVALQCLKSLEQLSVMGNASTIDASVKNFDFACRCFILYWSPQLDVLDGSPITEKERFTSWTLFLDHTHYPFSTGQHKELMEYLSNKCSKSLSPGLSPPINNENIPPNQESLQDTPLPQTPLDSLLSSVGDMNVVDTLKALQYVQDMIDNEEKLLEKSQPTTFRTPLGSKSPLALLQSHSLPFQPSSSIQPSLQSSLPSSQSTLVPPQSISIYSPSHSPLSSVSSFHRHSSVSFTQSSVPVTSAHQPLSLPPPTSLPLSSLALLYKGDKETSPTPCYYPSKIEAPPNEFIAHPSSPTSMSLMFKCAPPSPQNKIFSFYLDPRELKAIVLVQSLIRGFLCRKRNIIRQIKAAILIQSSWRGYYARHYDSVIVAVMEALYRKKVEGYIVLLVRHLQGCREELAHQVHMNQIQEETLKSLLLDVEELNQIKRREERVTRTKAAKIIQRQWRNYKVRPVTGKKHIPLMTSPLLSICLSLQTQVNELKSLVSLNQPPLPKKIVLPPPKFLKMSHYSQSCLLLQWTPPDIESVTGQGDTCPPFLGCRIYIDGELEGMDSSGKNKAYIEGLETTETYKITVRCAYEGDLESIDSNPVFAMYSQSVSFSNDETLESEGQWSIDELHTSTAMKGRRKAIVVIKSKENQLISDNLDIVARSQESPVGTDDDNASLRKEEDCRESTPVALKSDDNEDSPVRQKPMPTPQPDNESTLESGKDNKEDTLSQDTSARRSRSTDPDNATVSKTTLKSKSTNADSAAVSQSTISSKNTDTTSTVAEESAGHTSNSESTETIATQASDESKD